MCPLQTRGSPVTANLAGIRAGSAVMDLPAIHPPFASFVPGQKLRLDPPCSCANIPRMEFFKALLIWILFAAVLAAAIVASVKGGLLGILALVAVLVVYGVMFTIYGCKTH